ncbi:tRNA (guanine-N(7)-)-methyltransferase [Entomoplasma ellychniae]|uniref:tRNA (guanine-N(7)-)-methyltransferase n=1 Tax=Entomoplasma ellychniae TaxID=2114 RepID=A0A8E2UD41_9MOLU|nr:tRNA (guanosine(46)-N7)-methyltransferase TrmB [Entomoplasma ellychniae]PPE05012.1 tRNA (guanine-N(7)-)-methyltransferase [Entomoplasma ellychniae]
MRLRNKPWVREFLKANKKYLIFWEKENEALNLRSLFQTNQLCQLEIGCGKGSFISQQALQNADINYIGMEKVTTVVGVALKRSLKLFKENNKEMSNLKYFNYFAEDLSFIFKKNSIDKIYLNFSDPWPKAKHEKKRLMHNNFLKIYAYILKEFGTIEFKTDNDVFFEFAIEQINQNPHWLIISQTTDLYNEPILLKNNVATEYETKFHAMGKNINKLIIKKTN